MESSNCNNGTSIGGDCKSVSVSQLENSQINKSLTPAVILSCVRTWNIEQMDNCFSKLRRNDTEAKIGLPKLSNIEDFTPWWDEFSRPSRKSSTKLPYQNSAKDGDSFDNWFDKSHVQSDSSTSSWLCRSGPSNALEDKSSESGIAVADIETPSIYNQAPKTKGRRALKRDRKAEREKTLGKKWFEMRAPEVDDNTRMDMEMIRMRGVLDPKRFYKHNDRGALPKYFQMGTVVDEGTDFYSSRLTKKQRKQTLVEELMADANIRQYNKRKYSEVQQKMRNKKSKGKKPAPS